jgi:imidazolonepropionase-like amidohydrolase
MHFKYYSLIWAMATGRLLIFYLAITFISVSQHGCGTTKQRQPAGTEAIALVNAKIYPSPDAEPIEKGVVLINNGQIVQVGKETVSIPPGYRVINCNGLTITAGFWNCHVHLMEPKWNGADSLPAKVLETALQDMLTSRGFVYAFDLAALNATNIRNLQKRIESGNVKGPKILSVGVPFTPQGGSPIYIAPLKLPELSSGEEVAAFVNKQLDEGADGVKLWSASPDGKKIVMMPVELMKTAVAVAHKRGKPVFAHPSNNAGVAGAVASGVDVLAHVAPDDRKSWDSSMLAAMRRSGVALIPTLKLFKWELEREGIDLKNNVLLHTGIKQVSDFAKAGGLILFGTDVGYIADYDTSDEFRLLAQAGLSFKQILAALTTAPAKRFGYQRTGTVAKNMNADLVILKRDPGSDITAFAEIAYTIRSGQIIYSGK